MHNLALLTLSAFLMSSAFAAKRNINVTTVDTSEGTEISSGPVNTFNQVTPVNNVIKNNSVDNSANVQNHVDSMRNHYRKRGSHNLQEDASLLIPVKGSLLSIAPVVNEERGTSVIKRTEVKVKFQLLGCMDELFATQTAEYKKDSPVVNVYLSALNIQSKYSEGIRCNTLPVRTVTVFLKGHVNKQDVHIHFLNADYSKMRIH